MPTRQRPVPFHVRARAAFRPATHLAALAWLLASCGTPGVRGVPGTSPAPNALWSPPREATAPRAARPALPPNLPADLAERIAQLTLADVIDIALRNNSATSAAWADARAAAATYGAAKGQYYPTIDLAGSATSVKTVGAGGQTAVKQDYYRGTLNLSWLLLDFGGRSGSIGEAREGLLAADWTHNATLQAVVLTVERSYLGYVGTRALLAAQRTSLDGAQTSLAAAEQRHNVGLATIADVLQARTAVSQARLAFQATEGQLQTTRGALALSMGLPANVPYDIAPPADTLPPLGITDSVETLSVARAAALPSLSVGGSTGQTSFAGNPTLSNNYAATLTLSIPLFSGGSQIYDVRAASAAAEAAEQRTVGFEQQVVFEVFNAFYALRTATEQVRTSADLLASAALAEQATLGRYRAGAGSLLDLLAAQASLAGARAQSIQSRVSWYAALAQLAHDTGILGLDGGTSLHIKADTTDTNH